MGKFTASYRRSAATAKPKCEACGTDKRKLHVHHKDENPLNNEPSNLQTLCVSCHRLAHSPNYLGTPTHRKPCLHCSKGSVKHGLCNTHLTREKRYGDPLMKKVKIGSAWVLTRVAG